MILSHAALVALVAECVSVKAAAPFIVAIVEQESGRDTEATHFNKKNGTYDRGLGQINDSNLDMLSRYFRRPITPETILDPCTNIAASEVVLFARYNGSQALPIGAAYAAGVISRINGGESRITAPVTAKSPPVAARAPREKPRTDPAAASVFARPGRGREIVVVADRK